MVSRRLVPANAVNRERMLDVAVRLVESPSPTGDARAAADLLADILTKDRFHVERPAAGHPRSPAVVVRFDTGKPGPTIQFNGHLDVVHLTYVPPRIDGNSLQGSGSCDMKGGLACAVEALRAIRDSGSLTTGSILLTAHDLHEAPWGRGQQLDQLIRDGVHGDAVLIPEPLTDLLPTVGRGSATWKVRLRRPGPPIHEVMRPALEPDVIAAGADLVVRLMKLAERLRGRADPKAGQESLFIGQIHSGEIFNQFPQECWLEGTRRWLPEVDPTAVEAELRALFTEFQADWHVDLRLDYLLIRHAFRLNLDDAFVSTFRRCYQEEMSRELPLGPKPFVDDCNSFWRLASIPAITHGPRSGGQHTVHEWVDIDDMVRVARLYARIAAAYCNHS
jgi:acetylornithine deacetylase/succinyl-diaminopimelate desuccinylase-like protein